MNTDGNYVSQFKDTIEKIVDAEIEKRGTPKYVSAIIQNVNDDGTVNVYLPPDLTSVLKGILNKTGETLSNGDSVELCTKNGSVNNSWVAIKHKTNTLFAGTNVPNTFTQDQTFNGALNMFNYNKIYWKEPGYGDKFTIEPRFSGADDQNYLAIRAAVGDAETDPDTYNIATFSGKSGHFWVKGHVASSDSIQATKGFWSNGQRMPNFNGWCSDANDALYEGRYYCGGSSTNLPGSNPYGYLRVRVSNGDTINHTDNWGWQEFYNTNGRKWIRYIVNTGGWSPWKLIAYASIVLYDNASGTNGDITLSDSAANYEYIEIFFRNNDNKYNSVKVYQPHGKSVSLMSQDNNSSKVWLKVTSITISGTTITKSEACEVALTSGSSPTISSSNNNYITRVVGYK